MSCLDGERQGPGLKKNSGCHKILQCSLFVFICCKRILLCNWQSDLEVDIFLPQLHECWFKKCSILRQVSSLLWITLFYYYLSCQLQDSMFSIPCTFNNNPSERDLREDKPTWLYLFDKKIDGGTSIKEGYYLLRNQKIIQKITSIS